MGPYTAAHVNTQGAGDARPTALQIIQNEAIGDKLVDKVIIITGASSGIGLETARALSSTGATLFLTGRDSAKAETALKDILEPGRVSFLSMDLGSFASIRAVAAKILTATNNQINILINNAGIMGVSELQLTEDGHEMHFATNHLGHFLLFQLLKPALLASVTPQCHSRVVVVSSAAHRVHTLSESEHYSFHQGGYDHQFAYANSKLAEIYMANEIDRRYGSQGLHATSLHPGGIVTDISRFIGPEFVAQIVSNEAIAKTLKSPQQGAATTVIAAVGKEWENRGGRYLEDCEEAKRGEDDHQVFGVGWVQQTYDPEQEQRLWKDSLKMVGMADDL